MGTTFYEFKPYLIILFSGFGYTQNPDSRVMVMFCCCLLFCSLMIILMRLNYRAQHFS